MMAGKSLKGWVGQWRLLGLNLADVLSLSRPFLAILLMATICFGCAWQLNLGLVIFFAMTDFFDGLIARKCELVCSRGARLDEISDKVAITMLFGFFVYTGKFHWIFFVLFTVREIYVTYFRSAVKRVHPRVDVSAKLPGKIKTCLQFVLVAFLCLPEFFLREEVMVSLLGVALIVSYASAIYLVVRIRMSIKLPVTD